MNLSNPLALEQLLLLGADLGVLSPTAFFWLVAMTLWSNAEWKSLAAEEKAKRRAEFTSGEPGFGISACNYFAERKIILTGGDTSANDAQPQGENDDMAVECHTELQTRRGIWNIENLDLIS